MVMSWFFTIILATSVIVSFILGNGDRLTSAILEGAQAGISLSIALAGSICLWSGVGLLMDKAGMTGGLSRLLSPILYIVFPSTKKDKTLSKNLSANICANILGLGNAATPMGIRAARQLVDPSNPKIATHELCRLIVLNTASIQLIPGNVAAVRANLGASSPFDILPVVWITSLCSAGLGLLGAWLMGKVSRNE